METGSARGTQACSGPAVFSRAPTSAEISHSARIYRRKERVCRCRSSVMKRTVI
jgi:hypothetical protein